MIHGSPFARRVLVLLVAGLLGAMQRPAAAQATEAEFLKGLRSVQSAMRDRKWSDALETLGRLLETHADRPYVRARRAEIVELHRRSLFHSKTEAPAPDDVVSGDVLSCNLSTGQVKIRYTPANLDDFKAFTLFRLHPARFAGTYTVEIRGDRYPKLGSSGSPCIWICLEGKGGYGVSFGFPDEGNGRWLPARIVSAEKQEAVAEKEITLARPGKAYRLRVKVTDTLISAYYDGKPLLQTRKARGLFGQFGFSGLTDFRDVVVQGKAEPSWIQGRIDAALAREQKAFASKYRAEDHLPKWLFEAGKDAAARDASAERDYPGTEPSIGEQAYLDRAATLFEKREFKKLAGFLERCQEGEIAAVRRDYLLACCHAELEAWDDVLARAGEVCKADPDFTPAHMLCATANIHLGRPAEALKWIDRLIALRPDSEEVHELRIVVLLTDGRPGEAHEAVVEARRRLPGSGLIEKLHVLVVKADKGPDWSRTYEYKSPHYHVRSDIDRAVCAEAAKVLENAYRAYNARIQRVKPDNRRFRVYLFSGEAGFLGHCQDALGSAPVNAAGVYSPLLKQLLIWNLPDRETMMRTVRHEGFHQYLDRILSDAPVWLNEGLAEYYETAEHVLGRWKTGLVRREYLEALAKAGQRRHTVKELVGLTPEAFYRQARFTYPGAWALAHFMIHGPKRYRDLLDDIIAELAKPGAKRAAVDRVLGKVDLDVMETELQAYLKGLSEPR
jgi:Flp pilus assembly protein TadD